MDITSILLFFGPPIIAFFLGLKARIKGIRYFLICGSVIFILIFGIWNLLHLVCSEEKLFFYNCTIVSQPIADIFSTMYLIALFAYVFASPLLLAIFALLEWLVRLDPDN